MSMTAARDDLRKVIEGGIYEEYNAFILAQAVFLSTLDYAQGLNEGGFGELFGVVQGQCINAMILSLTKVFDATDGHNRPRSIPEALRILTKRTREIELANDGAYVLPRYGIDPTLDKDATIGAIVARLDWRRDRVDPALTDLRTVRDKYLAHRDRSVRWEDLPARTLGEINAVVGVVEEFLGITGVILFNTDWFEYGQPIVKAQNGGRIMDAFSQLMKDARVPSRYDVQR